MKEASSRHLHVVVCLAVRRKRALSISIRKPDTDANAMTDIDYITIPVRKQSLRRKSTRQK